MEQLFNIPLESSYAKLGADGVFKIWWFYQLLMFLQLYLILPCWLIWIAHKHFPEFSGFEAKPYPGQQKPRTQAIVPRREKANYTKENMKT